jgi:hypothetical protein
MQQAIHSVVNRGGKRGTLTEPESAYFHEKRERDITDGAQKRSLE